MRSPNRQAAIKKYLLLMLCAPFLTGWQEITLSEHLNAQPLLPAAKQALAPVTAAIQQQGLTPFRILEKTTLSLNKVTTMHVFMEAWFEDPLVHIKSEFESDISNIDNYKTDGRTSISLIAPNSLSTSQWIQTYQVSGIPFTWDLNKREWVQKDLQISSKDTKKALEYSILRSLFSINEQSVDPDTVKLVNIEKRNGKQCFVVQYKIDAKMFKYWNSVGDIKVKTWIDTEQFLPVALRAEGKIADTYILQMVTYSGYNKEMSLRPPSLITEKVKQEKDKLQKDINALMAAVAEIRGWKRPEYIRLAFKDRVALGTFLSELMDKEYTQEQLHNEGAVFKWLGLLHPQADYKDSMLNSQISSVAALYDPKQKMILLGDWLPPSFAEVALVHEIAHAFQDANVAIDRILPKEEIKTDYDLGFARRSLLEGEATAVMLEYLLKKDGKGFLDLEDIFSLVEERLLNQSPYAKENLQYNVYGYGANFIQTCLRRYGWLDLDRVYKEPPSSMSEVLHSARYLTEEKAVNKLEAPDSSILPKSWKQRHSAKIGEFLLLASLRQKLDRQRAEEAVSGWLADTFTLYQDEQNNSLGFFISQWDSPQEAADFSSAYNEWLKKRYPEGKMENSEEQAMFEAGNTQMFACIATDTLVRIVWAEGVNREDFKRITQEFYDGSKKKDKPST
jgi:hypothetical protein